MSDNTPDVVALSLPRETGASRFLVVALVFVVALSGVVPTTVAGTAPAAGDADSLPPVLDGPEDGSYGDDPNATSGVGHPKVADGLLSETPAREDSSRASRIPVVVETVPDAGEGVRRALEGYGSVRADAGTLIEATVRQSALTAVADLEAVEFVRPPYRLSRADSAEGSATYGNVTSEGASVIGATRAHAGNYTGDDVTVAVIDAGFDPEDPEISEAVVGTKNFASVDFGNSSTAHGTATAEIVLDTAPDADLQLVKVQTYTQMVEAAEWIAGESEIDARRSRWGFGGESPSTGVLASTKRSQRASGTGRAGSPRRGTRATTSTGTEPGRIRTATTG